MNTTRCYSACNPIARDDLVSRLGNWAIAATAVLSLGGCTVVRIDEQGATTTVTRKFGVVTIAPGSKNSVVSVTSFGVHSAFGVLSLGFGRTEAATFDPAVCQLILWHPTPAALLALRNLMGAHNEICTISKSISNNNEGPP